MKTAHAQLVKERSKRMCYSKVQKNIVFTSRAAAESYFALVQLQETCFLAIVSSSSLFSWIVLMGLPEV